MAQMTTETQLLAEAENSVKTACRKLGLLHDELQLLRLSSHATFKISDRFIGRVAMNASPERLSRMQTEVNLCRFLASESAPATRPTQEIPCGPHVHGKHAITFWEYEPETPNQIENQRVVEALQECHRALRGYWEPLPSYLEDIDRCFTMLKGQKSCQFLTAPDHAFLMETYPRLIDGLGVAPEMVLHGDCHLGNVLSTAKGPIWTDFESACVGPLEWDLTSLPHELLARREFDSDLFHKLSVLRSWCVATWCWMDYDKSIEKREAAEYHLQRVKVSVG